MQLHNTIIYLIGIPAVGKYTVARAIGRLTGAKVVDNQLINLPVFSVLGYDGTAARRLGADRNHPEGGLRRDP
jgi:MoxR-like ATPase